MTHILRHGAPLRACLTRILAMSNTCIQPFGLPANPPDSSRPRQNLAAAQWPFSESFSVTTRRRSRSLQKRRPLASAQVTPDASGDIGSIRGFLSEPPIGSDPVKIGRARPFLKLTQRRTSGPLRTFKSILSHHRLIKGNIETDTRLPRVRKRISRFGLKSKISRQRGTR